MTKNENNLNNSENTVDSNHSASNTQLPTSSSQLQTSNIELRSEEVQDILTKIPHWLIRWGSLVILFILLIMLFVSWMIKYPDTIKADIIITTQIPPEKLIARTSGRIETILVKDNAVLKENTPLAVIENSSNYQDVFLLKNITDTININQTAFPFEILVSSQLGDLESPFAIFQKEYSAEALNKQLKPFAIESSAQNFEAIQLRERLHILESQKAINQVELVLQKSDLNRYKTLHKKGVIASQELEKQKLLYLQAQKGYKSLQSTISQLKSSINDLSRNTKSTQINETKEAVNLERNVMQAFYQLKKAIKDWELNYVLRTSINGKVSFLQLWSQNQTVAAGDQVFSIIPINEKNYVGKVKAIAQNSGKIKIGQDVKIRLANYPDREFGVINGKIKNISAVPDKEGNLLIDVSLPNGLDTSYDKKINFQQEMTGTAAIITEDLRLIERLLYQFRAVFSR